MFHQGRLRHLLTDDQRLKKRRRIHLKNHHTRLQIKGLIQGHFHQGTGRPGTRWKLRPVGRIAFGKQGVALRELQRRLGQGHAARSVGDAGRLVNGRIKDRVSWGHKPGDRQTGIVLWKFDLIDHAIFKLFARGEGHGHEQNPLQRTRGTWGDGQKWKRHAIEGMMGNSPYSRMSRVPSASCSASAKKGFKLLYAL